MPESSRKSRPAQDPVSYRTRPVRLKRLRRFLIVTVCVIGLLYGAYRHFTSSEFLRQQAVTLVSSYLAGAQVTVADATCNLLSKCSLKNLRVYPPHAPILDEHLLLEIEHVTVHYKLDWKWGQPPISQQIIISEPRLTVRHDLSKNTSNLDFWLGQPPSDEPLGELPRITIENGVLVYQEIRDQKPVRATRQFLSGHLRIEPGEQETYQFELHAGESGLVEDAYLGGWFTLGEVFSMMLRAQFDLQHWNPEQLPSVWNAAGDFIEETTPSGQVRLQATLDPAESWTVRIELENGAMRLPESDIEVWLHDVSTEVSCRPAGVLIHRLEGSLGQLGEFYLAGSVAGYQRSSPLDLELRTHNLTIPPGQWDPALSPADAKKSSFIAYVQDRLQSEPLDRFFERFQPTGELDVELALRRKEPSDELPHFSGRVLCRRANMIYERFPYPFVNIAGSIDFEPNEYFVGPLVSRPNDDDFEVRYEDRWYLEKGNWCYDIEVEATNTPFDEELYRALKPWQQKIWDQVQPSGTGHATYRRQKNTHGEISNVVDVDMLDVQARYADFPVELEQIRGTCRISGDGCAIHVESAQAVGGEVSLQAQFNHENNHIYAFDGKASFTGAKLDESFVNYLPEEFRTRYEQCDLTGTADGSARFWKDNRSVDPAENRMNVEIHTRLYEASARHEQFPYPLEGLAAELTLTRDTVIIHQATAKSPTGSIQFFGSVAGREDFEFNILCDTLRLDEPLQQAIEKIKPGLWDKFRPGGTVSTQLHVKSVREQPLAIDGTIGLLATQLKPEWIDYDFRDVSGQVRLTPEAIWLEDLSWIDGTESIRLAGMLGSGPQVSRNLQLSLENIDLDQGWYNALTPRFKALWDRVGLSGSISGDMELSRGQTEQDPNLWQLQGKLHVADGGITRPVSIERLAGTLAGSATYDPKTDVLVLNADGRATDGTVMKRSLENIQTQVSYDGSSKRLRFTDLQSDFYQGKLGGNIEVMTAPEEAGYVVELVMNNVDLRPLTLQDQNPSKLMENIRGTVKGWYNLSRRSPEEPRRGRFFFDVSEAVLGELSPAAKWLHVPHLSWPKEGAFNEVTVQGHITGNETFFDSIYMKGSALSVTGLGIMTDPNAILDLIFVVGSPRDLPPIPGVDLLKILSPAFIHVEVAGTLREPQMQVVPLPVFERAMEFLRRKNREDRRQRTSALFRDDRRRTARFGSPAD